MPNANSAGYCDCLLRRECYVEEMHKKCIGLKMGVDFGVKKKHEYNFSTSRNKEYV